MKKLPGYIIILEMCTINGYHMMYGCSDKERDGQNFLSFCAFFLSFYPANKPENQLLGKIKTMHGDIIILHLRTLNDNHMMHGSWDIEHDRQNFLSSWDDFLHFYTPLITRKIKFWKNSGIIILHKCTKNLDRMLYYFQDMTRDGYNFYFSFWTIFCPFTQLTTRKIKIFKKK